MKRTNTKWWDRTPYAQMIVTGIIMAMLVALSSPIVIYSYTQRFVVDNNATATKGILFQKTIYLKEYKHLGKGNGLFGNYDRYSRSDRHSDVLSVYKD